MKENGVFNGEKCNRNGCIGIIKEEEKKGCCSCHINPPCSYCTTQTEYCPICGWSADEDQREYEQTLNAKHVFVQQGFKSDYEEFSDLTDGEFGYIYINSGSNSITRIKGKHPNMSMAGIYSRLSLSENPNMPRMKRFTDSEFELTYFCD